MMRTKASKEFKRRYRRKNPRHQKQIKEAVRKMREDLTYPSLQVKRMQGHPDIWEARASYSLRISFRREPDLLYLRTNCTHDQVYQNP